MKWKWFADHLVCSVFGLTYRFVRIELWITLNVQKRNASLVWKRGCPLMFLQTWDKNQRVKSSVYRSFLFSSDTFFLFPNPPRNRSTPNTLTHWVSPPLFSLKLFPNSCKIAFKHFTRAFFPQEVKRGRLFWGMKTMQVKWFRWWKSIHIIHIMDY